MGNKIARTTQASATEYYLHDLPSTYNLVLLDVVSRSRFLKSVRCKHDEGLLLVKVYFKRAGEPIDLKEHERRLERIRNAFKGIEGSHVWPFQVWLQTDKAAYLLRQYFFNNLHDRLSTRPFLSQIAKKWLAFQLIHAVEQSHSRGVCHGDIKCENVLVTSWSWLYLADFASFKPTYIPDDDPSDFSFYFDTGGRRRCYLAPERFYEHGGESQIAADAHAPLQPSMDIFSLGCVLAELFLEGQPLFELSQLLAYRRGQYDPIHTLEKIQDTGIREMILHMIQLDPKERLSCRSYLQKYESVVFPIYFSKFLHKFFSDIVPLDSDARVEKTQENFEKIHEIMMGGSKIEQIEHSEPSEKKGIRRQMLNSPGDSTKSTSLVKKNTHVDHQQIAGDLNFLLKEVEHRSNNTSTKVTKDMKHFVASSISGSSVIQTLQLVNQAGKQTGNGLMGRNNVVSPVHKISKSNLRSLVSGYDGQSDTYSFDIFQQIDSKVSCEGMVLLASLLCSCIRSVKKPELRRATLILLRFSSSYIDDDSRLQLVVPYVIAMLSDPAAIVRCAALETLCDVLCLVQDFPISDAVIFPEYILPMLSLLPDDTEESVRVCYASNIHKLALTAYRFLLRSRSIADIGPLDESVVAPRPQSAKSPSKKQDKIDGQLADLRKCIYEIVQELVMGPKQTPNVRRALLQDIGYLCYFFGHKQSNDFLLPILPAFLNDHDEQLRAVFFGQIVFVCYFIGSRSVEEYLLPYLEQALSDDMEAVLANALDCLTMMCKSGYLRKRVIVGLFGKALPLLCHPINWVKLSAVKLVAACSESLGSVDTYVYLSPHLRHFLHREPPSLSSETALLSCLKPPVSKSVLYQALEDAQDTGDILLKSGGKKELTIHGGRYPATAQSGSSTILEDAARLRAPNISSNISLDLKDSASLDKSLYSGFALHASSGNSSFYDGLSKGIPSYSVSTDKRGLGETHMVPDSSVYKASIRLPWLEPNRPGVQTRDDHFSSKQRDLSINDSIKRSSSLQGDSISNSDTAGLPSFTRSAVNMETGWRPRGVLVAHLQEHRLSVNDIAVSNDNTFFVTASDDSSIKIWDTRKLEKDIAFRSRLTYSMGTSRALCTTMLHGNSQVVVGASDGTLHLFSVDCARGVGSVVERYSGIVDVKRKDIKEGAILSVVNCSYDSFSPTVLFSTEHCGIHKWDTRANSESWSFKSSPEEGYISALVVGQCGNWFISGSSRGVLTLWDNRFLLPVNSWHYSTVSPIEKLCLLIPPPNSISSSGRPLVFVAAGCNEVSLWNAENGSCHQMFRTASTENEAMMPKGPLRPLNKSITKEVRRAGNYKYRIEELNDPPIRRPGIRSLLPLPGGDLVTGGTDLNIRYWDQARPEQSFCIAGPSEKEVQAKGVEKDDFYSYDIRSSFGVQVVQEICKQPTTTSKLTHKTQLAMAAADSAGCHRDAILALASFNLSSQRLISASRDGAVKVWK